LITHASAFFSSDVSIDTATPCIYALSLHDALPICVQYTTVQNWSNNVYNLVTKRAKAFRDAEMFWLDCNLGSKVTMKYPAVVLRSEEHTSELQSRENLVCRLLLEKNISTYKRRRVR